MENKIILSAKTELQDNLLRKKLLLFMKETDTRIKTINDRTKLHTFDINDIKKRLSSLSKPKTK